MLLLFIRVHVCLMSDMSIFKYPIHQLIFWLNFVVNLSLYLFVSRDINNFVKRLKYKNAAMARVLRSQDDWGGDDRMVGLFRESCLAISPTTPCHVARKINYLSIFVLALINFHCVIQFLQLGDTNLYFKPHS